MNDTTTHTTVAPSRAEQSVGSHQAAKPEDAQNGGGAKGKLDALMAKPVVAHIMRAVARFGGRLGSQFAAAVTYFSVLALVPIAMLGFSALGFVLSNNPGAYDDVTAQLSRQLGSNVMSGPFGERINEWMHNWRGIGIVGALTALYAGAGWVSNLKNAIRAQWRPEFEVDEHKHNFVVELLINMGLLIGLLLTGGLTLAASAVGTALNGTVLHLLHLDTVPGASVLTWLLGFVLSIITGLLLFLFIYGVMPHEHAPKRDYFVGSLLGAVSLAVLQSLAGVLIAAFAKNKAAALFGPVIVLMLAFNIFAQIALFIACWIATTNQPAIPRKYNKADEPLKAPHEPQMCVEGHWEAAEEDRKEQERKKERKKQEKIAKKERSAWAQ